MCGAMQHAGLHSHQLTINVGCAQVCGLCPPQLSLLLASDWQSGICRVACKGLGGPEARLAAAAHAYASLTTSFR
jgi:hypothetical protein